MQKTSTPRPGRVMSNKTQILIAAVIAGLFAIGIVVSDGSNGAKLPPPAPSSIDIW